MAHLPPWIRPVSPWGAKGRPPNPEIHAVKNELTTLHLRVRRIQRHEEQEAAERQRYQEWQEHLDG